MYLVRAISEMSAPSSSGLYKTPEPQELSTANSMLFALHNCARAGRSHISKVSEPGTSA
ncbi:hypothetical protein K0038_05184 [Pseudomonas syringae]|nr:hypothetical protein [Pseudomonas syringae]